MNKNFLSWNIFILVAVSVAAFLMVQISNYSSEQATESILASVNFVKLTSDMPQFSDYPVDEIFEGTPASVDLSSNSRIKFWNESWQGVLIDKVKEGPNFAGHYTIAQTGCGTMCWATFVIDAENGKTYDGPTASLMNLGFRKDSSLFILHPPEVIEEYLKAVNEKRPEWLFTEYYKWENNGFIFLKRAR